MEQPLVLMIPLSPKFLEAAKAIKEQQLHLKKSLKGNVVEFKQIK